MKTPLRPKDFVATVTRGKPGAAYFLRGPDRFLHEECRAAIIESIPDGLREWCLADVEFKAGELRDALEGAFQMPMLGGHHFLLFSDSDDFRHVDEADQKALAAYLAKPSSFATVAFAAYEPDRRRSFIQTLEKMAEVVEMTPLGRPEAVAWLKQYLEKRCIGIDPQVAEAIAARFETGSDRSGKGASGVNLLWMRTEMEKLITARYGAKRLEKADLELIFAVREEHEIGKLLTALADRQLSRALQTLRVLLSSKEPETLLLWCTGDLFRQALKSVPAAAYGRSAWNRGGNPYSTFEIAPRALKAYSRQELLRALRLVRAADLNIKSSWKDSRVLLESLIWQIMVGGGAGLAPGSFAEAAGAMPE
ncbi:MAG: DNA polymerase III subunit delta [Terriglobia bacterium]